MLPFLVIPREEEGEESSSPPPLPCKPAAPPLPSLSEAVQSHSRRHALSPSVLLTIAMVEETRDDGEEEVKESGNKREKERRGKEKQWGGGEDKKKSNRASPRNKRHEFRPACTAEGPFLITN